MYKMYCEDEEEERVDFFKLTSERLEPIMKKWDEFLDEMEEKSGIIEVYRDEYLRMKQYALDHGYVPESTDIVKREKIPSSTEKPRPWEEYIAKNAEQEQSPPTDAYE